MIDLGLRLDHGLQATLTASIVTAKDLTGGDIDWAARQLPVRSRIVGRTDRKAWRIRRVVGPREDG